MVLIIICSVHINNINVYLSEDSKDFKASTCFVLDFQLFLFVFEKLYQEHNK